MEGDLKGYCSGKWTLTFQTPPSYGVPLGPKNLTTNSSSPPSMVTSCLDSINFITSVSMRRFPALGDDILVYHFNRYTNNLIKVKAIIFYRNEHQLLLGKSISSILEILTNCDKYQKIFPPRPNSRGFLLQSSNL